ncbi:hypothetical protein Ancab_028419 [Ancistrocladus abbreviatus]
MRVNFDGDKKVILHHIRHMEQRDQQAWNSTAMKSGGNHEVEHRLPASSHYQQQKMFLGQQSMNRDKIRRVRKELRVNQFCSTVASSSFSMMGHRILDDAQQAVISDL